MREIGASFFFGSWREEKALRRKEVGGEQNNLESGRSKVTDACGR
jgi:hypothetical protein